nr:translation initiation factor IF-2-like [Equus asinus]
MEVPRPPRSGRACALRVRPAPAREALTAVEGGRGEGKEHRTRPRPASERAVPASPAPAPVVRSRPLRTASRSVGAGRAPCFPSSPLCPGARRRQRGNARRAVRLRKGAGGAPPAEWVPLPGAPPLAPPPAAISCSGASPGPGARGLRVMDARKPGQQRPGRRGCAGCRAFRCPRGEDGARRLQLGLSVEGNGRFCFPRLGLWADRGGLHVLVCSHPWGVHLPVYAPPRERAHAQTRVCTFRHAPTRRLPCIPVARPRGCARSGLCPHFCSHHAATDRGLVSMDSCSHDPGICTDACIHESGVCTNLYFVAPGLWADPRV